MDGPNMDSMGFAANVLNYVDALSKENGAPIPASILKPFDENILDLIDLTRPASTDIYVIQDGTGFVKSTVPDEIAFRTGTKSDPAEVLGVSGKNRIPMRLLMEVAAFRQQKPKLIQNPIQMTPAVRHQNQRRQTAMQHPGS